MAKRETINIAAAKAQLPELVERAANGEEIAVLLMPSPRLYRVIAPVDDIESATRFYSTLFGLPGVRVSPGRHYFSCGAVTLALYSPKADGDARTARPNFDHVYFAVDDLDDVYERARRLGGLSASIGDGQLPMGQTAVRPWGERSFYLSDPFGNPLCFVDAAHRFLGEAGVVPASPGNNAL